MDVLVGLQYGDEGKGKITDMLCRNYDIVARYQGGDNAGHTIYYNKEKIVLHLIPSGITHDGVKCFLGNGMVINPISLMKEVIEIEQTIPDIRDRIFISENASIITPSHIEEDKLKCGEIGTTSKGIGPSYRDKVFRKGLRVKDIYTSRIFDDIANDKQYKFLINPDYVEAVEFMRELNIVKSNWLREESKTKKKILAEGAQGAMLDIDHGSYPFVTSSTTLSSGAPTGLAMPAQSISKVYGVFKCYLTRVGNGDMETELSCEIGEHIQRNGSEFGATTGRPRRCGWLNLDELKEAVELNGVTDLIMTKTDILNGMDEVKIYKEGQYHTLKGWKTTDVNTNKGYTRFNDDNLYDYIDFIEDYLGMTLTYVSISPERDGIVRR